jgi:hypothetical protein
MLAHAKHRPPSSAARWLSCPGSVQVMGIYAGQDSDASIDGTAAHELLNTTIEWGVMPEWPDIEQAYRVMLAVEWIKETTAKYGKCEAYYEQRLEIPETGEFGTCDAIFVTNSLIHIMDYKDGYVPVDINKNAQLMVYLLGAIAKWGERPAYRITIVQPKYVHRDGMIRTMDITPDDMAWFRGEVQSAMIHEHFAAGKHCRKTYCPHRSNCETFLYWARDNLQDAWYPSDFNAMTDEQLGEALDHADILQGYRDQLRGEAFRRMARMDRQIPGYDLKKGKSTRAFSSEQAQKQVMERMVALGATESDLYERIPVTVAGVERFFKRRFKRDGRGAWLKPFTEAITGYVTGGDASLVVEKDIDGRKSWKKGGEFTALKGSLPDVL